MTPMITATRRGASKMHRGMRRRCGASLMHPTMPELGDRAGQNCRTVFAHPKQTQRVSAKVWRTELRRIYGAPCRGILLRMTRHKHAQTGLVTPQLPQHWLTAALRMLAMLVLHVASTLQMIRRREAVIGTQPMPTDLPQAKTDPQSKETQIVAASDVAYTGAHTTACHPGNAKRYPGPIVRARHTINGSRLSLRSAGMTTEAAQQAHPHNNAPPSLRSSRRKSGPRASRVICVQDLHQQPCTPAFAGTSGDLITS